MKNDFVPGRELETEPIKGGAGWKNYRLLLLAALSMALQSILFIAALRLGLSAWASILCVSLPTLFSLGLLALHIRRFIRPLTEMEKALQEKGMKAHQLSLVLERHPDWMHHPLGRALSDLNHSFNEQYNSNILNKQAELDALQSQINPHFLYNTLDSIRGKAYAEKQDEIAEMTEALSSIFRYSISRKAYAVTLEEELINIQNYFKIQQFRFDQRFVLEIKQTDCDELLHCRLPKLTLQPIVENAIYHGLEEKMGQGKITISLWATDARVVIRISDNGVGIREDALLALQEQLLDLSEETPPSKDKHSGIALYNVNRRIKLLCGAAYGLNLYSTAGFGTDVEITVPVILPADRVDGSAEHASEPDPSGSSENLNYAKKSEMPARR